MTEPETGEGDVIPEAVADGWVRKDEGGTGDCGYRSLAAAFEYASTGNFLDEDGARRQGAILRTQAVGHVRSHKDDFYEILLPDKAIAPEHPAPEPEAAMRTYLEKAAGKHTWIDGLMLQAVAKKLGAILVIWYKQGGTWRRVTLAPAWTRQGCPKTAKGVEPVVLILENQHYSWFQKPPGKKVRAGWIRASQIPPSQALFRSRQEDRC